MLRRFGLVAAFVAAFLSLDYASASTPPGKRVALVMGNSAYQHAVELPNPKNDAKLMSETLRRACGAPLASVQVAASVTRLN